MAALLLACKIEECPRKIHDIIQVFYYLIYTRPLIKPLNIHSNQFQEFKSTLVHVERHVLKTLGFHVHFILPHGFLMNMCNALDLTQSKEILQSAWNYANDAFYTTAVTTYPAHIIACAAINKSCQRHHHALSLDPPWYPLFDAALSDLEDISDQLDVFYTQNMNESPLELLKKHKLH
jgi:hypothetical protein